MKRFKQFIMVSALFTSVAGFANATESTFIHIADKTSIESDLRFSISNDLHLIENTLVTENLTDMLATAELTSSASVFLSYMNNEIKQVESASDE